MNPRLSPVIWPTQAWLISEPADMGTNVRSLASAIGRRMLVLKALSAAGNGEAPISEHSTKLRICHGTPDISPHYLQCKLQLAGWGRGGAQCARRCDGSKTRRKQLQTRSGGREEIGVVDDVERLESELDVARFGEAREANVPDERSIPAHETGAAGDIAAGIPQAGRRRRRGEARELDVCGRIAGIYRITAARQTQSVREIV